MKARRKTVSFDTSRSDFAPYGLTCTLWAPEGMPRPDRHNEIEVNYLPSGRITYLLGPRLITLEPRRLALFWAAVPHQVLSSDTAAPYYVVTLPLASFLRAGYPSQVTSKLLAGELVVDPAPIAGDEARFRRWTEDLDAAQTLKVRAAELEIQARLLRLAQGVGSKRARPRSQPPPRGADPTLSRADQLACYIAQHYEEPLTAERIARAVGLHPNYAMALFRRAFGVTMTEFVVQHRLSHAQRLLITTDDPIVDIAAAAGFQGLSWFNEAFKRACGCSPRDFRKQHSSPQ
jgi:AraC-like DNA-binding protein